MKESVVAYLTDGPCMGRSVRIPEPCTSWWFKTPSGKWAHYYTNDKAPRKPNSDREVASASKRKAKQPIMHFMYYKSKGECSERDTDFQTFQEWYRGKYKDTWKG